MTEPEHDNEASSTPRRFRSVLAVLLGVVAVIGMMASSLALWARSTLFDPANVQAAVENTLADPEVTNALATKITDMVFEAVDVESSVNSIVPDRLDRFSPALVNGIHDALESRVVTVLDQQSTRETVAAAVGLSHRQLLNLLDGDGGITGVSLDDDAVVIDVLPLVGRGVTELQELGIGENIGVPDLAADGDRDEQLAELEDALGRQLAPDFGEVVVYRSDAVDSAGTTIASAQRAMVLARRGINVVLALTLASIIGCILLARRRLRAVVLLGLAGAAVMLIARIVLKRVVSSAPDIATSTGGRAAIAGMVDGLAGGLVNLLTIFAIVGFVGALIAYFSDRSTVGHRLATSPDARTKATTFVTDHRSSLPYVALAFLALGLLLASC